MKNTRIGFSVHAIVAIMLIFAVCGTAEKVFTKIAQQDNITYYGFPNLAINSSGNVLFQASIPGSQSGYFTGRGGTHQEILTTSDGFSDLSYATINDGDMVAFSAKKNGEFGMSVPGIFSTTGGTVNDLAMRNTSDPCGFDVLFGWPHINSDTVAFPARLNTSRYAIRQIN